MKQLFEKFSSFWVDGGSEDRHHTRRSLNRLLLTAPLPGRILDVNSAGIGIETLEPLAVRTRNTYACAAENVRFEFLGEVRWCQQSGTIPLRDGNDFPVYRAGIAFVEHQQSE
jgi:hypothetical protein